jgi:hypothetical protein
MRLDKEQPMAQDPKLTRHSDRYLIFWRYDGELSSQEASQKQEEAGYHPAGYGFYGYKFSKGITTWTCGSSCD